MTARFRLVTTLVGVVLAGMVGLSAQVELDRILSRVNGKIVTHSDVRQAQQLKLVDEVGSEAATQRALENRLLLLGELSRTSSALPPATSAELDARRREWEATLGGAAQADSSLSEQHVAASGNVKSPSAHAAKGCAGSFVHTVALYGAPLQQILGCASPAAQRGTSVL